MPKAKQETIVNFILDKSGSMSSVIDSTISGFNEYLNTLKKDGNSYKMSVVLFDTNVEKKHINENISDVKELTKKTYVPDGMTSLYDAACITIDNVKKDVKKNQKVLTVIMTDGQENSSREYNQAALKSRITELEATGKWTFVFMGANQDAWLTAQQFGMSQGNTLTYSSNDAGVKATMRAMSANTSSFAGASAMSTSSFFSQADQQNISQAGTSQTLTSSGGVTASSNNVSAHFSALGKKSWEARKKKLGDK